MHVRYVSSFFRRKLPENLISLSSPQGRRLFREAMDSGHTENFFDLVGNFASQTEPTCKFESI